MTRPDLLPKWTRAEDKRLRETYAAGGIEAAESAFPHRTRAALFHRAQKLCVRRRRRWTANDDAQLRLLWGSVGMAEILKKLGRTRKTTYWRAQKLGLRLGCPQGWEYITTAARRTGYAVSQLRRILAAHGVDLTLSYSRTEKTRRFHVVQPHDVDVAVAAWLATETVRDDAIRRGMCDATLRDWLIDAGLEAPRQKAGSKKHWRLPSTTIDAVIAERETLVAAAKRVGVQHATLARWLAEAGVARVKAFVRRSGVDRVVAAKKAGKTRAWPALRRAA
jgi:hypothetical protein